MPSKNGSGFFRRLFNRRTSESEIPFKPIAPPSNDTITDTKDDIVNNVDEFSDISLSDLNQLTQLAERRDQRYTVYDEMRQEDSLASAVLEMYADDVTQPDPQGRTLWVESDNANIAEAGNRLLRILKVEEEIWAIAYNLACYGDVYFELFPKKLKSKLIKEGQLQEDKINIHKLPKYYDYEDYIERVNDPSEIFDLINKGRTVAFARTHVNDDKTDNDGWNNFYSNFTYRMNNRDIDVYDSHKFIHIYVPDAGVRHPFKFIIDLDDEDKVNDSNETSDSYRSSEYTVLTGKSLLQDAYKTSQQLQLAENSILLSRLTRASVYRLIQINVGTKSEKQALSIINRLKTLLDKKQTINTKTGTFSSYNNPGPEVSNIILPVRNDNQGAVSTEVIGGDYDPKSLSDIDYLVNKELASFKVPRQFLNFTDGGGFNGGSSLAKISSQYAHRIVRYKRAITLSVTDLLNIFFDARYPDYVGKFEVKMTPVNTVEDAERVAMAKDKLDMVGAIMDKIDNIDDEVGKFEILKDAFEDAYPNSVVSKVLGDYITKLKSGYGKVPKSDEEGTDFPDVGNVGSSDSFLDIASSGEGGSDIEDIDLGTEETGTESSSEFPTDLGGSIDYTDTAAIDDLVGEEG